MAPSSSIIIRPLAPMVAAMARFTDQLYQPPKQTIRGIRQDGWYSPLQPVAPFGPPGTEPRGQIFFPGQNLNWVPRFDAEYSAAQLRTLATYPLASICISNVKDAIVKAGWGIQLIPKPGESKKQVAERGKGDEAILKLSRFFEKPDREHTWSEWLRPILDDMLVIDAAAIQIRKTFSGELAELVRLPGESIVRYIDNNGLTPIPPDPAYAQNWWGMPLVNLTTDQLVYKPRNIVCRNTVTSQMYGMSPTEQLAKELEIGIERLNFTLAYYTEGSIPGMLQIVPKGVSSEKMTEAMLSTNTELAGNFAKRWQLRLIQGFADHAKGEKDEIMLTKAPLLADAYDEMHTKRVCFGYGTSPQRLMKQVNRASAEQSDDAAETEGTLPYFTWLKEAVMDYLIRFKLGYADYEWVPDPFKEPSFEKMAKAANEIMSKPVFSPNEMRERFGLDPRPEPEMNTPGMGTANGWVPVGMATAAAGAEVDGSGKVTITKPAAGADGDVAAGGKPNGKPASAVGKPNGAGKEPAEKTAHARSTSFGFASHVTAVAPPLSASSGITFVMPDGTVAKASAHDTRRAVIHPERSEPETVKAAHAVEKILTNQFKQMKRKTTRILAKALGLRKSDKSDAYDDIRKAIDENWKTIADDTWQEFEAASLAGAVLGALQVEITDDKLISKINVQARDWARERSAELVGMRRTESGRLVKNPDAKWAITDATRDKLRRAIADLFETEDATLADIESAINKAGIFDPDRATVIARTEVSRAQTTSNLMAWRESGEVVEVGWQLSADHDHDDLCDDNADLSPYPIEDVPEFPAHPNCLCALVLETLKGEEEE